MANRGRRTQTRQYHQNNPYRGNQNNLYRVNGSAAYQPDYAGPAVRQPKPQTRPQVQPRRQVAPRPRVQVRPAGTVSLLAVVGFGAVAVFAALLLIANAKLMVLNDETVSLRAELKTLQAEETRLLSQRDSAYDLDAIEAQLTASGAMVKPQPSQVTYLSAEMPDSLVKYERPRQSFRDAVYEKLRDLSSGLFS